MVSQISIARKNRSEQILKTEGVQFLSNLPVIEDERTANLRSLQEIVFRAMALCVAAVKGEGLEHERVLQIITEYKLDNAFSPKERQFVYNDIPTDHERIQFSWQYECYWVLLWALG